MVAPGGLLPAGGGPLFQPREGWQTVTPRFGQIQRQFEGAQREQREAAEAQHQQLLEQVARTTGDVRQLFGRAHGAAQEIGGVGREDVARRAAQEQAAQQQQLLGRGMGAATAAPAARRGVAADAERRFAELDEADWQRQLQLFGQQIGAEQQLGQWGGQAILSAQHQPPDMGMYMQLIQQLAGGMR